MFPMRPPGHSLSSLTILAAVTLARCAVAESGDPAKWREEGRIIDLHMHLDGTKGGMMRAIGIMDRVGLGVGVNLSGGTVTHKPEQKSAFEKTKNLADTLFPGRFIHSMNLDY